MWRHRNFGLFAIPLRIGSLFVPILPLFIMVMSGVGTWRMRVPAILSSSAVMLLECVYGLYLLLDLITGFAWWMAVSYPPGG